MIYLCLAAGKGTRFAGLGSYLQKCMYPIGVHPFVEYSVAAAITSTTFDRRSDEIAFVVGHHAEQIWAYFGDAYHGIRVRYVEQTEQKGTGHAVDCARRELGFEEAVVWLADLYVPTTLFDGIRSHSGPALTIGMDDEEDNDDVRVDFDDTKVIRAWRGSSEYYDIGLWKFDTAILDRINDAKTTEFRVLLNLQAAIEDGAEVGYQITEEWIHLGGVHPTVSAHIAGVIDRMKREESIFDHI